MNRLSQNVVAIHEVDDIDGVQILRTSATFELSNVYIYIKNISIRCQIHRNSFFAGGDGHWRTCPRKMLDRKHVKRVGFADRFGIHNAAKHLFRGACGIQRRDC